MKKLLIILGIIVLIIVIGAGALFVGVKAYLTPKKVSALLSERLESSLHHKVKLGPVTTGFSSAKVQGFSLLPNNPNDKAALVKVKNVSLSFSLIPLLKKKLDIKKITIIHPVFYLVREKNGTLNWQKEFKKVAFHVHPSSRYKPERFSLVSTAYAANTTDPAKKKFTIEVGRVEIDDGTITWVDHTLSPSYKATLNPVVLELEHFSLTQPFDFTLKGVLKRKGETRFSLRGEMNLTEKNLKGKASASSASLQDFSPYLKEKGLRILKGSGTLDLTFSSEHLKAWKTEQDLSLKGVKLSTQGKVSRPINASLKGSVQFDEDKDILFVKNISGKILGSDFTLEGTLRKLRASPMGNFEFQSKRMDLDALMGLFGLATKASEGTEKRPASSKVSSAKKAPVPAKKAPRKKSLPALPTLKIKASIHLLLIKKVKIQEIKALITTQKHQAVLDPFSAEVYGGTVKGKVAIDLSSGLPFIRKQISIKDVDIGPLLSDMNPSMKEKFTGRFFGDAQGRGVVEAPSTYKGNITFHVEKGSIQNVKALKVAAALMKLPSLWNLQFDELKGKAKVHNRLIDVRNVRAKGKDLLLNLNGTIGFNKKLNLTAQLELPYRVIRKGLGKRSDLFADKTDTSGKKWSVIPLKVKGTTRRPLVTVKFEKKAIEKIIEKNIHDKKIKKLLKKLF